MKVGQKGLSTAAIVGVMVVVVVVVVAVEAVVLLNSGAPTTSEIFIPIIVGVFTLLASLLSVFLERRLHERQTKRRLFRALYDEIRLNFFVAQKNLKEDFIFSRTWSPLYTLSYQNIRSSGELMSLAEDLRIKLEETYELIYFFNKKVEIGHGLADRPNLLSDIVKNLEELSQEFKRFTNI